MEGGEWRRLGDSRPVDCCCCTMSSASLCTHALCACSLVADVIAEHRWTDLPLLLMRLNERLRQNRRAAAISWRSEAERSRRLLLISTQRDQ